MRNLFLLMTQLVSSSTTWADVLPLEGTKELALPFAPDRVSITPNEEIALLRWGKKLAVVDLTKRLIVAESTAHGARLFYGLDDKFVYMRRPGLVTVHDVETLEQRGRVFTRDGTGYVHPIRPGLFAIPSKDKHELFFDLYRCDTFKLETTRFGVFQDLVRRTSRKPVIVTQAERGLQHIGPLFIHLQSGEVRWVENLAPLERLGASPPETPKPNSRSDELRWAYINRGYSVLRGGTREKGPWPGHTTISRNYPIAMSAEAKVTFAQNQRHWKVRVRLYELHTRDAFAAMEFVPNVDNTSPAPIRPTSRQPTINGTRTTILTTYGPVMRFTPMPVARVEKISGPPRIVREGPIIASVDKVLRHRIRIEGGKPPLKLHVENATPELYVDSDSGSPTLVVDLPRLWDDGSGGHGLWNNDELANRSREIYQRITAKPLEENRVAYSVPVALVVSDSTGTENRYTTAVLALSPPNPDKAARSSGSIDVQLLEDLESRLTRLEGSLPQLEKIIERIEKRLDAAESSKDSTNSREDDE